MKRKLLIASIVGIVALAVFPSVVGNRTTSTCSRPS
jgi:hypothetical protein